jgi:hypothetical protein
MKKNLTSYTSRHTFKLLGQVFIFGSLVLPDAAKQLILPGKRRRCVSAAGWLPLVNR